MPGEQIVLFEGHEDLFDLQDGNRFSRTKLIEYFVANVAAERAANEQAACLERGEQLQQEDDEVFDCRTLLYPEFPGRMVWDVRARRWKVRKAHFGTIGRMYYVSPTAGDRFFLRLLLLRVPGATSFQHLRTVDDFEHPTFKSACVALELINSDDEWDQTLGEAAVWQTGSNLRWLFVCIVLNCLPADPLKLWNNHKQHLSDDCANLLRTRYVIQDPTEEQVHSLALSLIRELLEKNASSLEACSLPAPQQEFEPLQHEDHLILEQRNFDVNILRELVVRDSAKLNAEQRVAFERVCQAVRDGEGGLFFLDGFGGTEKTFVINLILAKIRSERRIALAVASSRIAATLLDGGTTAHSRFKIPIEIHPDSTCSITAQCALAELIRAAELAIWDEAVMQHRHVFECVERTFRDIRQDQRPFGGLVMCFCGDFRQLLPVVVNGSKGQIIATTLNNSSL